MYFHWKSSLNGLAAGMNGSIRYPTTMTISATAIGFIHLYFAPLVQLPSSKLSPCRQRSQIGIAKARYSPATAMDVTA